MASISALAIANARIPTSYERRRIRDVRAADLQEKMAEQRFSVPPAPTKTAAAQRTPQRAKRANKHSDVRAADLQEKKAAAKRTSQRAERAIKHSAMREQLKCASRLRCRGARLGAVRR